MMKIHLVTYGNERFAIQRENLKLSALYSKFFDEITVFTPNDLDEHFKIQFNQILSFGRGGGYWLWKPYFLKKAMDNINDGDILIYLDAGCMVNIKGRKRFEDYIDQLINDQSGSLLFHLHFKEYQYTKQEIFNYFRSNEAMVQSGQRISGIILFRKCANSVTIVEKWLQAVYDDPWLFTDYLLLPQRVGFIENRHDQSVLSMITKIHNATSIPDETYFLDFEKEGGRFPFWATRLCDFYYK